MRKNRITRFLSNKLLLFYLIVFVVSFNVLSSQSYLQKLYSAESSLPNFSYLEFLTIGNNSNNTKINPKEAKKEIPKLKSTLSEDTSGNKGNSITNIYTTSHGDELVIKLNLIEDDSRIQVLVYNLLGKTVLEPQNISQSKGESEHQFNIANLPNGVYLCVVHGKNYRLKKKFYLSRE